jgi:hypothetical protein
LDTEVPQWLGKHDRDRVKQEQDDLRVLQLIAENPRITLKAIAENLGWTTVRGKGAGQPRVTKAFRAVERLRYKGQLR